MSDKLRAAAKAALDLLDNDDRDCAFAAGILRVALAEQTVQKSLTVAEQEPVCEKDPYLCGFVQCQLGKVCKNTPRREWVGLTDEEITQGNRDSLVDLWAWESAVLWAEAKLREKNK